MSSFYPGLWIEHTSGRRTKFKLETMTIPISISLELIVCKIWLGMWQTTAAWTNPHLLVLLKLAGHSEITCTSSAGIPMYSQCLFYTMDHGCGWWWSSSAAAAIIIMNHHEVPNHINIRCSRQLTSILAHDFWRRAWPSSWFAPQRPCPWCHLADWQDLLPLK